jgi:RNA polymerase-binding transcription factor DksA
MMQSLSSRKHIMTDLDLRQQENQLQAMRASLVLRLHQAEKPDSDASLGALTVQSLEIEEAELEHVQKISLKEDVYARQEFELKEMQSIDQALHRIELGIYGVCLECGEKIALRRLQVAPEAPFCLNCQSRLEHQREEG